MQEREFFKKVAINHDLSLNTITQISDAIIDQLKIELKQGNRVNFTNFGTFDRTWHQKRLGIDPYTKIRVQIPAHYAIKFKTSKIFKEEVKQIKKEE